MKQNGHLSCRKLSPDLKGCSTKEEEEEEDTKMKQEKFFSLNVGTMQKIIQSVFYLYAKLQLCIVMKSRKVWYGQVARDLEQEIIQNIRMETSFETSTWCTDLAE